MKMLPVSHSNEVIMNNYCYSTRMGDGQTVGYKILGILHHIAPDKEAQNTCTRMFNSIPEGFERDKSMVCALADGYLYGNWPWLLETLKSKRS